MKKHIHIIILIIFITLVTACLTTTENQKREYGTLVSAVTYAPDKIIGEYGDTIPNDFSSINFMEVIKDKIPEDYYKVLTRYNLEIYPKGWYYLLLVSDPNSKALILFDYSCTPEADGTVLLMPGEYSISNLEMYNKCTAN